MTDSGEPLPHGGSLAGARIIVTRPAERGEALCREITAAGGDALLFPTLDIQPLEDTPQEVPAAQWLVFVSVPAVTHGVPLLDELLPAWRKANIAAIGAATEFALREAGIGTVLVPPPGEQQSEGLLGLPGFAPGKQETVLLVRGDGGRRLLEDSLSEQVARVANLRVYRRVGMSQDIAPLLARWREAKLDAIVISSADGLRALHAMLDDEGRRHLASSQLVLPTARMLKLAQDLGIQREPLVSEGAGDTAVMATLEAWWQETSRHSNPPGGGSQSR